MLLGERASRLELLGERAIPVLLGERARLFSGMGLGCAWVEALELALELALALALAVELALAAARRSAAAASTPLITPLMRAGVAARAVAWWEWDMSSGGVWEGGDEMKRDE